MSALFEWCDDTFDTAKKMEKAIASSLCEHLCNADAGTVTKGDKVYVLEVSVKLVETE